MKLYFSNRGNKLFVSEVKTREEALKKIRTQLDKWDIVCYYIRMIDHSKYVKFDYGSHINFFYLDKENKNAVLSTDA